MSSSILYVFDDREDTIHQAFVAECGAHAPAPPYVTRRERLVLGDVVMYRDGALWATIERKRYDDLVNSFFVLGQLLLMFCVFMHMNVGPIKTHMKQPVQRRRTVAGADRPPAAVAGGHTDHGCFDD